MKGKQWLRMGMTVLLLGHVSLTTLLPSVSAQSNATPGRQGNTQQELTDEDFQIIADVYYSLKRFYIEDIPKNKLLEGALKGMVEATGDPYSEYLTQEESSTYVESETGSFTGVGIQFMARDGLITVISAIDGTPAAKANIQPKDVILKADGTDLTNMDTNDVVKLIRGETGSAVTLTIQRADKTFDVVLKREEIPIITVEAKLDSQDVSVGYIKITQFNGTTYDELKKSIEALRKQGAKAFIFDLRYNPGGLLDQALKISNMFLDNKQVIMQVQEAHKDPIKYQADDRQYGNFKVKEPFVLLVNDGSASASEILTGAIKENLPNPIVGTKTFGKGTVQNFSNNSYLGELKMTFAKWLTPTGVWIHESGIQPTVEAQPEKVSTAIALNPEETLKQGDASQSVESLGLILNALGYLNDPTTFFDDAMEKAVKTFQADHDLEENGQVTGDTVYALSDALQTYFENHDVQYDKAKEVLQEFAAEQKDEAA